MNDLPETPTNPHSPAPPPPEEQPPQGAAVNGVFAALPMVAVVASLGAFAVNMWLAWDVVTAAQQAMNQPLLHEASALHDLLDHVRRAREDGDPLNDNEHLLFNRILDSELQLRAGQAKSAQNLVALGASFALTAVGFALFVMGARGTLDASAEHPTFGWGGAFSATAPGLAAFVLAAFLAAVVVQNPPLLETGSFTLARTDGALPEAPDCESCARQGSPSSGDGAGSGLPDLAAPPEE